MTDPSTPGPVVKWSEQWWANAKPEVRAHRCTAHRKTGDRCKRAAINGGRVCTHHGGSAPAVKAKARERLEDAADRMARELLKMAVDENVSDAVKLAAIRDALDRAGLSARTAVSVEVGRRPFEQIFDYIVGGSRAESRAHRGVPDDELNEWQPRALAWDGDAAPVVDAEVIDSPTAPTRRLHLLQSDPAVPAAGHTRSATSIRQEPVLVVMLHDRLPAGYRYTDGAPPGRADSL